MSQPRRVGRLVGMIKWLVRNRLSAFEHRYGYDMSYARDILAIDLAAFMAFARLSKISEYRRDIPSDAYWAAKLTAVVHEDCGPCSQLMVAMALEAGVAPSALVAVATRNTGALSEPIELAARFATAACARSSELADLRDRARARWGPRAVVSLAYAVTSARIFPTLKYALGYGTACHQLEIAGHSHPIIREAA